MRFFIFTFLLAAIGTTVLAAQQEPNAQIPAIVTTGEATIRRVPDQAFLSASVETRSRLPRDAQKQNADTMTAVLQKLTEAGISKDAVRTTGYSIQQEFDFSNGRRTPRDYLARNGIEIRLDGIERVGEMLDLVVQAGATSVLGVRFDLKDRVTLERDVLMHAVQDARARADALAAGAGRTVDRVIRIDDSSQPRVIPQPMMTMRAQMADSAPTPVEPGYVEIRAQVTLTVSIK